MGQDDDGDGLLTICDFMRHALSRFNAADLVYGQFETAPAALWEGFRLAKAHGVTTALNPSPWQALSAAQLALCDLLIVNEVEAAGLLGNIDLAEADLATCLARLRTPVAALMARWQGQLLVVTLGARGALAFPRADAPVMAPAAEYFCKASLAFGLALVLVKRLKTFFIAGR